MLKNMFFTQYANRLYPFFSTLYRLFLQYLCFNPLYKKNCIDIFSNLGKYMDQHSKITLIMITWHWSLILHFKPFGLMENLMSRSNDNWIMLDHDISYMASGLALSFTEHLQIACWRRQNFSKNHYIMIVPTSTTFERFDKFCKKKRQNVQSTCSMIPTMHVSCMEHVERISKKKKNDCSDHCFSGRLIIFSVNL